MSTDPDPTPHAEAATGDALVHTTRLGESIAIPREHEDFYGRLCASLGDKTQTPDDLYDLLFDPSNPLLDPHPEGGVRVTPGAFRAPLWRAGRDILVRKDLQENQRLHNEGHETAYTLSPREAADMLGIKPNAVRAACDKGTLRAIRNAKGTRWLISHTSVEEYRANHTPRGPQAAPKTCTLHVRAGHKEGAKLFFKCDGERTKTKERLDGAVGWEADITDWTRAAVETSRGQSRFFLLAPKPGAEEAIEFEGFYVRGPFEIVEKVNNSKKARARMAGFHNKTQTVTPPNKQTK